MPQWIDYVSAVCQQSTASLAFNTTANAPLAACKSGTNTQVGVARFTTPGQTVQGSFVLPDDWVSLLAIEFRFLSDTANGSGVVVWNFAYACAANAGASVDPAFGGLQTGSVAAGPNNVTNLAVINAPAITGCSAGQRMYFRLGLDGATTAAGNHNLLGVRFN